MSKYQVVYAKFTDNEVAETEEVLADTLFVDRDSRGEVVGIEVLAPLAVVVDGPHTRLTPPRQQA